MKEISSAMICLHQFQSDFWRQNWAWFHSREWWKSRVMKTGRFGKEALPISPSQILNVKPGATWFLRVCSFVNLLVTMRRTWAPSTEKGCRFLDVWWADNAPRVLRETNGQSCWELLPSCSDSSPWKCKRSLIGESHANKVQSFNVISPRYNLWEGAL